MHACIGGPRSVKRGGCGKSDNVRGISIEKKSKEPQKPEIVETVDYSSMLEKGTPVKVCTIHGCDNVC